MTGLVRKATLLTLCGLLVAGAAMAGVPSSATSSKPACINLVGTNGTVTDPAGQFTVTVRDVANNAVANSQVKIDFSGCVDINIGTQASQLFAGLTVNCTNKTITAVSNATGIATFRIVGSAKNPTGGVLPKSLSGCASISADNQPLGTMTIGAFNEDGSIDSPPGSGTGVAGNDLSAWKGDFFTAGNPYYGRSDFDCNGAVGGNDLSVWLTVFFAAGAPSGRGASAQCP